MKKYLTILFIILLTSGCWNYRELNEFAIVTGMAVDYQEDKYQLSFLIANGNKNESEQAKTSILTGKGITIYDAFKDISLMSPKELYISHLSVVIISEDVAKKGINNLLDYLLRDPQSHQNFYMVIAKDSKAQDILSILSPLSDYPSQNITSNVATSEKLQGKISDASFNLFITKYFEKGFEPIMNSIIIVGNEQKGQTIESQEKPKQDAYTKLDTIALFKDDKLISWSTKEESIGIDMILGEVETLYFNVPCKNELAVIVSNNYKVDYSINKNKVIINSNMKGSLIEVGCDIDLENENEIKKLEKSVENQMKLHINQAISLAKLNKTDIFGFGNLIYKKYPDYYEKINNWNEHFSNLDIEVNTSFKFTSKGTLEQSINKNE